MYRRLGISSLWRQAIVDKDWWNKCDIEHHAELSQACRAGDVGRARQAINEHTNQVRAACPRADRPSRRRTLTHPHLNRRQKRGDHDPRGAREVPELHRRSFVDASDGRTFDSLDPYAGEPWAAIPEGTADDIDHAVAAARAAFDGEWGAMTGFQRAALHAPARGPDRARTPSGSPGSRCATTASCYRELIGQLQGLGAWYRYFAGWADKIEGRIIPSDKPNYFAFTRREPVGVVAAITPWNSPLLLMTWKLAPALAAGCTLVVKPSEHSPASTLGVRPGRCTRPGFPDGVFNVVTGYEPRRSGAALAGAPGRRQGRVHRLDGDRPGRRARRRGATSTGSRSSWAASRRRSCSRTPTSTRPPTASSPASSPPPGRPAWRARG